MIRAGIISIWLLLSTLSSLSQMCPGGGVGFSSAVIFDPAWIYGCNTGTSCNGGVVFNNRVACEPSTSMDACAPQPSCTITTQNASDIWFRFYPTYTNVTLSAVQNTSLVVGIQAFQGSVCGSLTEIGCAIANGPSSGVQLSLTGLNPGQLYYYRVFGSSHSNPQRTGLYCFCGTTGVQATILPLSLESLKGIVQGDKVTLSFLKPGVDDKGIYDIEYSVDGISFQSIYHTTNIDPAPGKERIDYVHSPGRNGTSYYRLKRTANGEQHYSAISKIVVQGRKYHISHNGSKAEITIEAYNSTMLFISDISGRLLKTVSLSTGSHRLSTADLSAGVYIVHDKGNDQVFKFVVSN